MIDKAIQGRMLREMYEDRYVDGRGGFNWGTWAENAGIERGTAMMNFADLTKGLGLAETTTFGGCAQLTTQGVFFVEDEGLGPCDLVERCRVVRYAILEGLARLREAQGPMGIVGWRALCTQVGVSEKEYLQNFGILKDVGYLQAIDNSRHRITNEGLAYVRRERERREGR